MTALLTQHALVIAGIVCLGCLLVIVELVWRAPDMNRESRITGPSDRDRKRQRRARR